MYKYEAETNLIKEGDYEVRIEKMEVKTVGVNEKLKLHITFRIRSDVEQPNSNKCVFEDIWEERETKGVINRKRINQLLGTQDVKEGTVFNDINEIINFMVGKDLVIHVVISFDDYNKKDVNKIVYYRSSGNKQQIIKQVSKIPSNVKVYGTLTEEEETEDDVALPF